MHKTQQRKTKSHLPSYHFWEVLPDYAAQSKPEKKGRTLSCEFMDQPLIKDSV